MSGEAENGKNENPHYDFVVCGSGAAGMTMSILLAEAGYSVLVLEKSSVTGGSMQRFARGGILFDTGFHFTGGLGGCMGDMLRVLGIPLTGKGIPFTLMFGDTGRRLTPPHGRRAAYGYLRSLYPSQAEGISAYEAAEDEVFRSTPMFDIRKDPFSGFNTSDADFITLSSFLDKAGVSGEARAFIVCSSACHGTPAFEMPLSGHARVNYGLLDDLVRVDGGGEAFVSGFRKRARELGITVRTSCTVKKCLDIEKKRCHRLLLSDGSEITCSAAVMTMHPAAIDALLPDEVKTDDFRETLSGFSESCGFFTVFAVLEGYPGEFEPRLLSYFSSADADEVMSPSHPGRTATGMMLTEEPPPAGRRGKVRCITAFETVYPSETERWSQVRDRAGDPSYREYKKKKCAVIEEKIYRAFPEFKGHLRIVESASMLTFRDWLSPYGSAYGVRKKAGRRDLFGKLPIRNFYVCGQNSLLPGAMGAMLSAFIIFRKITGEEKYNALLDRTVGKDGAL